MRVRLSLAASLTTLLAVSCAGANVAGRYVSERDRIPKDYLELRADGSFALQEDGSTVTGTYKMNGTDVALTVASGEALKGKVEAGVFTDATGTHWARQ